MRSNHNSIVCAETMF